MPSINDINNKKTFKKRDYRPWDIEGNKIKTVETIQEKEIFTPIITHAPVNDTIFEIHTTAIKNWEFHDRPESELGDLNALAQEFVEIGQQQPCIVRPILCNQGNYKYELIVGERRWRAAEIAGIKLKVIVKTLSDSEAAIIQASENHNRKDLSDYARGMSYANLIEKNILTQKELTEKLQISKQQVSRLISFSKLPTQIVEAIGDMSKISARTAEQITQLANKGENYINAIIEMATKLRSGEVGWEKLKTYVEKSSKINLPLQPISHKVYNKSGRHLFTWRQDNNSCPSIHFPKDIANLIHENKLNIENLSNEISEVLEKSLLQI